MTEGVVTSTFEEDLTYSNAGRLCPNTEAKVFDLKTGRELGHNEVGEIVVHSPTMMFGYFNNEKATRDSFHVESIAEESLSSSQMNNSNPIKDVRVTQETPSHNNIEVDMELLFPKQEGQVAKRWLRTGDVGYFCDNETVNLVDRIKEMIKYKGNQVSPVMIENHIRHLSGVRDAAVIGIPHPTAGEIPLAFVVIEDGADLTEEQVKKHVEEGLSSHDHLRGGVIFRSDPPGIPRSVPGKILRRQLQHEWRDLQH